MLRPAAFRTLLTYHIPNPDDDSIWLLTYPNERPSGENPEMCVYDDQNNDDCNRPSPGCSSSMYAVFLVLRSYRSAGSFSNCGQYRHSANHYRRFVYTLRGKTHSALVWALAGRTENVHCLCALRTIIDWKGEYYTEWGTGYTNTGKHPCSDLSHERTILWILCKTIFAHP